MNHIEISLERTLGPVDRNIFGLFKELRPMNRGIYQPDSRFADEDGFRSDVLEATRRLRISNIRCIGGNTVSGYRWRDGVGPKKDRPVRHDLAWDIIEHNQVGTNEMVGFCRKVNADPYLVVNCGDGDMREAADWVEYCNGTGDTTMVRLRQEHGFSEPHRVRYWGIGNEVDGPWQIGFKTPQEYARAYTEFAKVMKWTDPSISLIAAFVSSWGGDIVERGQLLLEQASDLVDYMAIHWYVGNPGGSADPPGRPGKREVDFATFMTLSELFEERLAACEGLIRAVRLDRGIRRPIPIAVDEWAIRRQPSRNVDLPQRLQDTLVVGMNFNALIRHAGAVKMANFSGLNRRLLLPGPDGLVLQASFHPFELYSRTCGQHALDVFWKGETFAGGEHTGLRTLDVSATLDERRKQLVVYAVNRSEKHPMETTVHLADGRFGGSARAFVVNGPSIESENTFERPNEVGVREASVEASGSSLAYSFEPHSVTALVCPVG